VHHHLNPTVGEIAAGVPNEVVMMAFVRLKAAVEDHDPAGSHHNPLHLVWMASLAHDAEENRGKTLSSDAVLQRV
jgi:hypothetical protein